MEHYFTNNENLESHPVELTCWCGSRKLIFNSDSGVFSSREIDDASLALVRHIGPLSGKVLDLGCGYGFIGIYLAAKYDGIFLTQSDVNRRALSLCRSNCSSNGICSEIVESDGFDHLPESFDHILLNPPIHAGKDIVYRLYDEAYAHLEPGGCFYIVIRKKHGAESSRRHLEDLGFSCEVLTSEKGIMVYRFVK